jgi:hypothetical protein
VIREMSVNGYSSVRFPGAIKKFDHELLSAKFLLSISERDASIFQINWKRFPMAPMKLSRRQLQFIRLRESTTSLVLKSGRADEYRSLDSY